VKLGKNFVIYLGSSVASGALPLALMPFLTRSLTPTEYGVMVTITTVVALVAPIVNWATTAYVGVQYFKTQADAFPALLSSVLLIPAINAGLLLLLFAAAKTLLTSWLGIPPGWSFAIPLMAAALLLPQIVQTILAMQDKALGYAAFEISGAVVNFFGTILLVLVFGFAWEGRVIAAALASIFLTLLAIAWLLGQRLLVQQFMPAEFKSALKFGIGGVAHDLANQAMRLGDRVLIVALIGQAAVGTYAVAVQWSSIMLTVLAAFNRAWVPFLFSSLSKAAPGWPERLVRQTYLAWGALLLFFITFNLATPIGYHFLVDDRYRSSIAAVFWLTLGYFFNGIYMTVVDYIFYLKKTHILAGITVFNLLLNTGLSYLLIQHYGSLGAAMGFTITAAIVMCLTFAISYRLHPMPWLRGIFR
jgi:O-antigen/teichoic acid export membrane protein